MSHLHPHRANDDEIFQRYLDRAIVQINDLSTEIEHCIGPRRGHDGATPVVGTGHPLADIFLLKFSPQQPELDEGVAFYGRSGEAVLRSIERLNVDPLSLYGTNCVKCSIDEPDAATVEQCPAWLRRELEIVQPKLLVVMGEDTRDVVDRLAIVDAGPLPRTMGVVDDWSPTCQALLCPDVDESLTSPAAKQEFWDAFRAIGPWYDERPPY